MAGPFPIRPRLLLVGNDITLLHSRQMLLGTRFAVEISGRHSEALHLLREYRFDLVVVLEPGDTWKRFTGFVTQQIPSPRLLVVMPSDTRQDEWSGAAFCEGKGMYDLMKCCMEVFGMITKTKSCGYSNRSFKKEAQTA